MDFRFRLDKHELQTLTRKGSSPIDHTKSLSQEHLDEVTAQVPNHRDGEGFLRPARGVGLTQGIKGTLVMKHCSGEV